jgi:hypothetical protein
MSAGVEVRQNSFGGTLPLGKYVSSADQVFEPPQPMAPELPDVGSWL